MVHLKVRRTISSQQQKALQIPKKISMQCNLTGMKEKRNILGAKQRVQTTSLAAAAFAGVRVCGYTNGPVHQEKLLESMKLHGLRRVTNQDRTTRMKEQSSQS
jgi:hypothetical protein